ncbi:hypothetical protein D9M72_463810 [compost metagenome]
MAVHFQRGVVDKAGVAAQPVGFRDVLHAAHDKADKAVALAAHAGHDLAAVDADLAIHVHAERRGVAQFVRGLGGGDQQLGGHAAHPGAGGAVRAAFDDHGALARGNRGTVGGKAGGACADHGDVGLDGSHGVRFLGCHGVIQGSINGLDGTALPFASERGQDGAIGSGDCRSAQAEKKGSERLSWPLSWPGTAAAPRRRQPACR